MFSLSGHLPAEPARPNIIYILTDDLGYGDLGCYGQEVIETPHIDKLCREGMKFTNHHSGSTVCAPSRASLLTGQHTGHVWVRFNGKLQLREDDHDITIARVLKNAGYHTVMIGKNGLGCNGITPGLANRKGFDYFCGINGHEPFLRDSCSLQLAAHGCLRKFPYKTFRKSFAFWQGPLLVLCQTCFWLL